MGMGYGAGYADVVSDEFVKKTCRKEFNALDKLITDNEDVDWDAFATDAQYDQFEIEEIEEAFVKLTKAFKKATGLELGIGFHDMDDEGDRYDDVNGMYWWVDGVWVLSKAGKEHEKHIDRKLFVTFG